MCILCIVKSGSLHLPTPVTTSVKKGQGGRKDKNTRKGKIKHKNNHHHRQKQNHNNKPNKNKQNPKLSQNASIVHEISSLFNDAEAVGISATSPTGRELLKSCSSSMHRHFTWASYSRWMLFCRCYFKL